MRRRSAGGRSSTRPHESMYTTSLSPFQRKVDCLYQVTLSSTHVLPLIVLRSTPTLSISTSTTSPAFRNSGGVRAKPTPAGVPVMMRSPDHSSQPAKISAMSRGILKTMNFVRESDPRPHRQVRVEVLSLEPLTAVPPLHIADRDIVRAGVPENMVHRGTGASSRAFSIGIPPRRVRAALARAS